MPPEVRVDKTTWLLGDMQQAEVDMRRLILEIVDENVFNIVEGEDEEADFERAVTDKTEMYNAVLPKVIILIVLSINPIHQSLDFADFSLWGRFL